MAYPINWTPQADLVVLQMRGGGSPWPVIARHLQVGRSSVIERARTLGIRSKTQLPPPPGEASRPADRPAAAAGRASTDLGGHHRRRPLSVPRVSVDIAPLLEGHS
jgi:hypothetical protein